MIILFLHLKPNTMINLIKVHFDGSCDNNSKFRLMGAGCVVFINNVQDHKYDKSIIVGGSGTSNIAEWHALILALETCVELVKEYPNSSIRVYGDSQLIVNQFNGTWRIKQPIFTHYYRDCKILESSIKNNLKSVSWVRRTENKEADYLSDREVKKFIKENML